MPAFTEEKKVNIASIAKWAGVSQATVSRVLTGQANVSETTRRRVRDVMDSMNYTPNPMARGLATGKLNIVALVVDLSNPYYAQMISLLSERLQADAYLVTVIGLKPGSEYGDVQHILSFGYCGIVMVDPPSDPRVVEAIAGASCPVILLNKNADEYAGNDRILVDNHMGGYIATKHLLDLGHRSIAMLRGPLASSSSNNRHKGYLTALEEYRVAHEPAIDQTGDFTIECGEEFGRYMIQSHPGVTAIFAGNDYMAIGVLNAYKQQHKKIPEEISIFGISSTPFSGTSLIDLTCIYQPFGMMGEKAAGILARRMRGEQGSPERQVLLPDLIVRGTTGPPMPCDSETVITN